MLRQKKKVTVLSKLRRADRGGGEEDCEKAEKNSGELNMRGSTAGENMRKEKLRRTAKSLLAVLAC